MKIGQTNSIIYKLQDKTCSEEEEKVKMKVNKYYWGWYSGKEACFIR